MNVVFLDFNGVLDTFENMDVIDVDNLNRLKKIVDLSNSKVVLTTSNKNIFYYSGQIRGILKYLIDSLLSVGIDVIGMVPMLSNREDEIIAYLMEHPEVENYVILDDDYDMPRLSSHLVKLPSQMIGFEQKGLEDVHVEKALNILGKSLSNSEKIRLF